jgi:alpha-amylase/alpha-mannosidase (GH57 family)
VVFLGLFSDGASSSGFFSLSFFLLSNILRFFPKISKISLMYKLLGDKMSKTFPNCFWKKQQNFAKLKKHWASSQEIFSLNGDNFLENGSNFKQ